MVANALPLLETETLSKPKLQSFSVQSHWLVKGDCRLDATFYADEAISARRVIEDCGYKVLTLSESASEIFMPALTLKIPFGDERGGKPYLTQSELFLFRPVSRKFVITRKLENPERWFIKKDWLVMSQSGTVGLVALVSKCLEKYVISPNPIRIVPRKEVPVGYLYTFLSTKYALALVRSNQFGVTVDHILPQHIESLPVPLLPPEKQQVIHDQILKAYRLRDEANELLDKAEKLLYAELELERFDESKVPYLPTPNSELEERRLKVFGTKASELADRFDVSFHLPIAKACVEQMHKGKYKLVQLGNVAEPYVAPRFRRIYVEREYGIPFLQGSHIPLMKPYDLKYLSRRAHEDLSPWILNEGWVLVTCSGTIGRVAVVPKALEGWAASQHIERIVPKTNRVHAGYLAAFLMTPYGQHQLTSKVYGGVVDELTEEDTAAVWLPDTPFKVQEKIGKLVLSAFEKKEEANKIENETIDNLEKLLERKL